MEEKVMYYRKLWDDSKSGSGDDRDAKCERDMGRLWIHYVMKCESGRKSYFYFSVLFYTVRDFKDVCATKPIYGLS